jgi:UDP-2,3-diacylglucosamine pyrophosphatase LpxH
MEHLLRRRGRRQFRSVWISDLHLGFHASRADALLDFLHSVECETLYLVGDIIDLWALQRRPYWPQQHNDVIRTLLGKAKWGTRIVYVPGNHDMPLRAYVGHQFGNVEIVEETIHTRASGERLLVIHGDKFDAAVASSHWLGRLGSRCYGLLLYANVIVNAMRHRLGFNYWSLAGFIKHKVRNAVEYIDRYERVVAAAAERAGADGVVCGHIHRPCSTRIGEIEYFNCGDWVESCTALVEHPDGAIELLTWQAPVRIVASERAAA